MRSTGIDGIAFSPYVGPWRTDGAVLFNTYTLDQMTQLLTPVAKLFPLIATYGQGTFVWQGVANIGLRRLLPARCRPREGFDQRGVDQGRGRLRHESSQELWQRRRTGHRERMLVGTKFDSVGDAAHQLCQVHTSPGFQPRDPANYYQAKVGCLGRRQQHDS